jgi:hypothetical protein
MFLLCLLSALLYRQEMVQVITGLQQNTSTSTTGTTGTEDSLYLYFSLLHSCWVCTYGEVGAMPPHIPDFLTDRRNSALGVKNHCNSLSRFAIRKECFSNNTQFLELLASKVSTSSVSVRLAYAVDLLTLQSVITACSRQGYNDKKRIAFSTGGEEAAKAIMLEVASKHPVLWNMFVPLFLDIIDLLGTRGQSEAYAFPLPTGADLPPMLMRGGQAFARESQDPSREGGADRYHHPRRERESRLAGRILTLTLCPRSDMSGEIVVLIDSLRAVVNRFAALSSKRLSGDGGESIAAEYSYSLRTAGDTASHIAYTRLAARVFESCLSSMPDLPGARAEGEHGMPLVHAGSNATAAAAAAASGLNPSIHNYKDINHFGPEAAAIEKENLLFVLERSGFETSVDVMSIFSYFCK